MVKHARALLLTLLAVGAHLAPATARAQLGFSFVDTPPTLVGTPGSTLRFFARLNNTSGALIALQGFNPGLTAPGLTITDLFFANVPDPLPAGTGPAGGYNLFNVLIGASAAPGTYTGTAVIDYDAGAATNLRVAQTYSVRVLSSVVPEPGTGWLLAPGILLLASTGRRRRTERV